MRFYPNINYRSKKSSLRIHFYVLLITGVIVFSPVASFSFLIGWDDQIFVLNRYTEGGLALKNISAILTEFYHGQYAPLNQLFYSTIFEFFGYKPAYFHVCSALIHLINTLLVYLFITQVTKRLYPAKNEKRVAFITSLLFLLAPINLEPVAWIAASKVIIYACFYLGALLSYIKYIASGKAQYYYLMFVSFLLSFASKEQALTLPLAMILMDFVFSRDMKKSILWWEKMPPLLLSALFVLASFQAQGRDVFSLKEGYSFAERLVLSFYTVSEYFTKILFPVNISYVYPFPFLPSNNPPLWLWTFPVIIILAVFFLRRYLIQKAILFSILFFLIHIAMVCNIISLTRYSVVADRYAYIASIGLLFLISIAYINLSGQVSRVLKNLPIALLVLYCGYFLAYTSTHIWVWQNAITVKQKVRTIIKSRSDYEN